MRIRHIIDSFSWNICKRSLTVSAVVGSILNLVNQGGAIVGTDPLNISQCLLNYLVPFLVATYGAVMTVIDTK